MKILILRGMQASGKSFWAKQFVSENQSYKRVNRDSLRHMLSNYTFNDANEKIVTKIEKDIIEGLIKDGYNIVIDNMNLNEKYLSEMMKFINSVVKDGTTLDIEIKEFPITLQEAIERDKNRPDSLGEAVLKKTWRTYELELKAMIERAKPKYVENKELPHCVICDIDGTLSFSGQRRIHDEKECINDAVILPVKEFLDMIWNSSNYNKTIFIFSGRKDSVREVTKKWLKDNGIYFYNDLYMRKADDNRDDTIVKSEMFEEFIRGKYYCDFVIDDRIKVLDMWNQKGLFTFNVNQDSLAKNKF